MKFLVNNQTYYVVAQMGLNIFLIDYSAIDYMLGTMFLGYYVLFIFLNTNIFNNYLSQIDAKRSLLFPIAMTHKYLAIVSTLTRYTEAALSISSNGSIIALLFKGVLHNLEGRLSSTNFISFIWPPSNTTLRQSMKRS